MLSKRNSRNVLNGSTVVIIAMYKKVKLENALKTNALSSEGHSVKFQLILNTRMIILLSQTAVLGSMGAILAK